MFDVGDEAITLDDEGQIFKKGTKVWVVHVRSSGVFVVKDYAYRKHTLNHLKRAESECGEQLYDVYSAFDLKLIN